MRELQMVQSLLMSRAWKEQSGPKSMLIKTAWKKESSPRST